MLFQNMQQMYFRLLISMICFILFITDQSRYTLPLNIKFSKTCLKRPRKIDNTNILMTNGSLMKVESIAECPIGAFCNTFDLH